MIAMTFKAAYWASSIRPTPTAGNAPLRTLALLGLHANDSNIAWPKQATIAAERGISERTAQRHLSELRRAGLIAAVPVAMRTSDLPRDARVHVWRLAVPSESTTQVGGYPDDGNTTQVDAGNQTQGGAENTTHVDAIKTGQSIEGEARAMTSEAQRELGGFGNPLPKRFPKQCDKHQAAENFDPCGSCGAARRKADERLEAERQARRQAEIDARKAESDARALAARMCQACAPDGYRYDANGLLMGLCRHETPAVDNTGAEAVRAALRAVNAA